MPMFLKGVWFIIAGVLLLSPTPAPAEPYVRVFKNGVVYYYFTNRQPPHPRPEGVNRPQPQRPARHWEAAASGAPLKRQNLPILPGRDAPDPMPSIPETVADLPAAPPPAAKEMILAGARQFLQFLTKLGYRYPLALPVYAAGPQRLPRIGDVPAIPEPPRILPEVCENFLKSAREQLPEPGQTAGPYYLTAGNSLLYCFPVAHSFSFRDSWGDYRPGGRLHRAVDIMAPEGTGVYAVTSGVIHSLATLREAGITLILQGQDGMGYGYMHLQGYAPGIVEGKPVRTGELLGYVGRTGIRESAAHLHFQVYADHRLSRDDLLNPYNFLVQLCRGVGVSDLYPQRIARLEEPQPQANRIQVYRRPGVPAQRAPGSQRLVKDSPVLVIRNY
jgi:murein DD-endopeptidase MepM/ murein hydrolase activator NlpD